MIRSHVLVRLKESGVAKNRIESTARILAPLEFWTRERLTSPWRSYFAPRARAENGGEEYPCLENLNSDDVEEWASLAKILKRPVVRARFADATWELGKRLGSARKDLHLYAQMAAELYLEAADASVQTQGSFSFLDVLTRSISSAFSFGMQNSVSVGFAACCALLPLLTKHISDCGRHLSIA
jgi:hypothetical protein